MNIAGIDYSMTCPCICVTNIHKHFTFEKCQFFFLTDKKYLDGLLMPNVTGTYFDKKMYKTDIERFDAISDWAMSCMPYVKRIGLEGYSMGSKGMVFNIGENTALLKYKIMKKNIDLDIYAPTTVKKFAMDNTTLDLEGVKKNKVKKELMYNIFFEETGIELNQELTPKKTKIDSPVSDIIDSYYICKLLRENIQNNESENPRTTSQ